MLTETLKIGVLITVNTLIESNFDAYPKHIKFTIFISFKIYEPENLPICLPEERSRMCFFFSWSDWIEPIILEHRERDV